MVIPPIILNHLSKNGRLLSKYPKLSMPLQIGIVGVSLTFGKVFEIREFDYKVIVL